MTDNRSMVIEQKVRAESFAADWPKIVGSLAEAFRLDHQERSWLEAKSIAQLIAAIPYLAGCEQPTRTAVAHVGTYLLSVQATKPYFNADPSDDGDILDRLRLIMNFRGGDRRVIDRGMALIGLTMIEDYKRDTYIDGVLGKYNPVASEAFDYDATKAQLMDLYQKVDYPAMDAIFGPDSPVSPQGFWGK